MYAIFVSLFVNHFIYSSDTKNHHWKKAIPGVEGKQTRLGTLNIVNCNQWTENGFGLYPLLVKFTQLRTFEHVSGLEVKCSWHNLLTKVFDISQKDI